MGRNSFGRDILIFDFCLLLFYVNLVTKGAIHGPESVYAIQVGVALSVTGHVHSCDTEKVVRSSATARIIRHATISTVWVLSYSFYLFVLSGGLVGCSILSEPLNPFPQ